MATHPEHAVIGNVTREVAGLRVTIRNLGALRIEDISISVGRMGPSRRIMVRGHPIKLEAGGLLTWRIQREDFSASAWKDMRLEVSPSVVVVEWRARTPDEESRLIARMPMGRGTAPLIVDVKRRQTSSAPSPDAEFLLSAIVEKHTATPDGFLIAAIMEPWRDLIGRFRSDPAVLLRLTPEQMEELIAASYDRAGFDEVTLTPRSGDGGRDLIAVKRGIGAIKIIEQVKRYKPGHVVTANDIRAFSHVLARDFAASKGIVTTTSDFAPGCYTEFADAMPTRLELRNGIQLGAWLEHADGHPWPPRHVDPDDGGTPQ